MYIFFIILSICILIVSTYTWSQHSLYSRYFYNPQFISTRLFHLAINEFQS